MKTWAPDRIGSDRLAAILWPSARRRSAPPPKTLSRFVEQGPHPSPTKPN